MVVNQIITKASGENNYFTTGSQFEMYKLHIRNLKQPQTEFSLNF